MSTKISARTEVTSILGTDMLGIYRPGTPNVDYKASVANVLTGALPMNDPATLNGINDSTTANLIYGVNVVQTSSTTNFATRLPATPVKGKAVVIVNNSSYIARVFPSVTGGSINGVVDGHIDIPADKKAYTFYCWENPLPGSWSAQSVLSNQITIAEMSIAHTNGVADVRCGTGIIQTSSIGAGIDGSNNLTLTPASSFWRTENLPTTAISMSVYTNIVADDCASIFSADQISVWRSQAYKDGAASVTSGPRETAIFGKVGAIGSAPAIVGAVSGGLLNSPIQVGDTGTFYATMMANNTLGNQLGTGGTYSRYYYIFGMQVPASAITKTYRFQIVMNYA